MLFTIFLSLSGVLGSYFFLRPEIQENTNYEKEILAYIQKTTNDVQKKTPGRVIWEEVIKGDRLFKGDMIRTSEQSRAEINFLSKNIHFEIGPETTILIEKEVQGFNLDVLKGDLFLRSLDKNTPLTVKANNLKMTANGASMGVTVAKGGDVDVQVFEGEARLLGDSNTVIQRNKKLERIKNRIVIKPLELFVKSPKDQNSILIHPLERGVEFALDGKELVEEIKFLAGETKSSLKNVELKLTGVNKIFVEVTPGPKFWKIEGIVGAKEVETPVFYTHYQMISLPQIILPLQDEFLYIKDSRHPITLKWGSSSFQKNTQLEVATDFEFKNIILSKNLSGNSYDLMEIREPGKYFWRVRGEVDGLGLLTSKTSSFRFKYGEGLIPPRQYYPENNVQFSSEEAREGVTFAWSQIQDAKAYLMYLTKDGSKTVEIQSEVNSSKQLNLGSGSYTWKIASISVEGKKSELSEARNFKIITLPVIQFEKFSNEIFLDGVNNNFVLRWKKPELAEEYSYRLSIQAESGEILEETLNESTWNFRPSKEGIYRIKVSALNSSGKVIALSNTYSAAVKTLPLLSAPKFSPLTKETKVTDGFGNLKLEYLPVKGAQYYLVEVKTISGKIVKIVQFEDTIGRLEGLLPGTYEIGIKTVDKYNRQGVTGELLVIDVPAKSGLLKPKMNKVQVR